MVPKLFLPGPPFVEKNIFKTPQPPPPFFFGKSLMLTKTTFICCCDILNIYLNVLTYRLLYFCDQSCIFSIITPVFSVTWSFRNHSTLLICCSVIISDYYQCCKHLCCLMFLRKLFFSRFSYEYLKLSFVSERWSSSEIERDISLLSCICRREEHNLG